MRVIVLFFVLIERMAKWEKIQHRGNVDDRRGMSPVAVSGGIGLV